MHTAPHRPEPREAPEPTVEQRLARIERSLEKVDQLTTQIPLLMATVTEIADSQARRIPDLDDRLEKVVGLLERLTRPQTMRSLETLIDAVEQAPNLISTAVDIMDDLMAQAAASGVHVESLVESTGQLLSGLFDLATSPEVRNLLESGMLDKGAVQTLGHAAHALADVRCRKPEPVGVFGALRAIGDPDVQRALGYLVAVGTAFGHQLSEGPLCDPDMQLENGA